MAPRRKQPAAGDDPDLHSPTGKHLPRASAAGATLSRAALELLGRAIPDELLREVVNHSAPMARLGGHSQAGAAALSRALKLLAQPPAGRVPEREELTLEEIGKRIDRTRSVVASWADKGLLGEPVSTARGRKWGRDGLERARLVDYLMRHDTSWAEVAEAARANHLPLLVLSRTLAGKTTISRSQMARQSGVPTTLVDQITRALGVASGSEDDEALYSPREVQAIRLIGALRSVYSDDDLVEVASVVGRAIHEVAEATLELFRRRFAQPFAEAGASELEMMLRLATVIDLTVPTTGPMLELVLRRQLEVTSRSEAVMHLEQGGSALDGQVELAVGFADIVGFTAVSAKLNALEVSALAARLLRCAEQVFPRHGARVVKTIGDAVMFTAPDVLRAATAAADLLRAWNDHGPPPLRVGIAQGPMLRAYADYFGRTVNVASRLSDLAPAETIYVLKPARAITAATWKAHQLRVKDGGERSLRGVDGRVPVLELRPID